MSARAQVMYRSCPPYWACCWSMLMFFIISASWKSLCSLSLLSVSTCASSIIVRNSKRTQDMSIYHLSLKFIILRTRLSRCLKHVWLSIKQIWLLLHELFISSLPVKQQWQLMYYQSSKRAKNAQEKKYLKSFYLFFQLCNLSLRRIAINRRRRRLLIKFLNHGGNHRDHFLAYCKYAMIYVINSHLFGTIRFTNLCLSCLVRCGNQVAAYHTSSSDSCLPCSSHHSCREAYPFCHAAASNWLEY